MKSRAERRNDHLFSSSYEKRRLCAEYGAGRSSPDGNSGFDGKCKFIFDIHEPIIEHIKNGVVTGLECNYMGAKVGKAISKGILAKPVIFRSHGGRAGDMENGSSKIDLAFLAAPVQMRWETAAENTARQPAVLWDTHF